MRNVERDSVVEFLTKWESQRLMNLLLSARDVLRSAGEFSSLRQDLKKRFLKTADEIDEWFQDGKQSLKLDRSVLLAVESIAEIPHDVDKTINKLLELGITAHRGKGKGKR